MSHNPVKKAAVLTGLTVLMGGTGVSTVEAATYTVDVTHPPGLGTSATINANQFNGPGTLTGVTFDLMSTFTLTPPVGGFGSATTVSVNGHTLGSTTSTTLPFNFDVTDNLVFANAAFYSGSGTFPIGLFLGNYGCVEVNTCNISWTGSLEVTYDFIPTAVPGPAVGSGLPGLIAAVAGLLGWRSRRKQKSAT